jgi:hypothetical protein
LDFLELRTGGFAHPEAILAALPVIRTRQMEN